MFQAKLGPRKPPPMMLEQARWLLASGPGRQTYLLDFLARHGSAFVDDKEHILGHCRKVLWGKVVHKVAVLNLWPE